MRPKPAHATPTLFSDADLAALQLLQRDCVMRHFPLSPQTTAAGRAEMTSRLCAQQALNDSLQAIREQAGWPARDLGETRPGCDDFLACNCPSLAKD